MVKRAKFTKFASFLLENIEALLRVTEITSTGIPIVILASLVNMFVMAKLAKLAMGKLINLTDRGSHGGFLSEIILLFWRAQNGVCPVQIS